MRHLYIRDQNILKKSAFRKSKNFKSRRYAYFIKEDESAIQSDNFTSLYQPKGTASQFCLQRNVYYRKHIYY